MKTGTCRFCGEALTHTFVDLGSSPLANSYLEPTDLERAEPSYPLHVWVCSNCLLVQLEELESPEHIFSAYSYFSSFSDTWLQHAKSYVEMAVRRFALGPESRVVEIASNDGYLLQYFVERGVPVLGIEPAANVAAAAVAKGVPTEVSFFGRELARELAASGKQADLIVGNNVLAHVPELNGFVAGLAILLKPQGVVTMEFPHLMRLMAENQFDTIYHEHFSYFSFLVVEKVFAHHGLTLFDVEEVPTHGGSLRIFGRRTEDDSRPVSAAVGALRAREQAAGFEQLSHYLSFGPQVQEVKRKLLSFLHSVKSEGKTVAGYGAPAKGNTLLNTCGVGCDLVAYTVDRSPHKQGRYLPGSHIPIHHPDRVFETKPDYLLILPWNIKDEVMEKMQDIRDWGGRFVVPIPEVRIFS